MCSMLHRLVERRLQLVPLRFVLGKFNEQERPRALMVSGPADEETYFQHMARLFEAGDTPWFESLLGALSTSPSEPDRQSSILILDDFDDEGPGGINVKFMRHFCKELYEAQHQNEQMRIRIVILTQKKDIANKLCRINNWEKIAPMPGSFQPLPEEKMNEEQLPDPDWTLLPWKAEELKSLVKRYFGEDLEENCFSWIKDGMNPTQTLRKVRTVRLQNREQQDTDELYSVLFD